MDYTAPDQTVIAGGNRRRVDRAIWVGLGRMPKKNETPAIAVEFVSAGKRNAERDYHTKREEYREAGVKEYWVIDRFTRKMTVFLQDGSQKVLTAEQVYTTHLIPGFELDLQPLFEEIDQLKE